MDAAALSVAQQYVTAFGNLAKTNNTLILSTDVGDIPKAVTQVRTYWSLKQKKVLFINSDLSFFRLCRYFTK